MALAAVLLRHGAITMKEEKKKQSSTTTTTSSFSSSLNTTPSSSTNPATLDFASKEHRLSKVAMAHKHPQTPSVLPDATNSLRNNLKNIDFRDGKTEQCNRDLTFDDFVPAEKLPAQDKAAKRMGATWDVVRAIVRLKRPLKKMRSKRLEKRMQKDNYVNLDREALLG